MTIEEKIFERCTIEVEKLKTFGFQKKKDCYFYTKNIKEDTFRIEIMITSNHKVKGKVYDLSFGEEYLNYRIDTEVGSFAREIRDEFETLLTEIRTKCTTQSHFLTDQANRIAAMIKEKYGDDPEFIWEKFPKYGVFRNANNKKWYGLIMNIEGSKMGLENGKVEMINVKLSEDKIQNLKERADFYPAYHMNKKHWISILFNQTQTDEEIMSYIEESHFFTEK